MNENLWAPWRMAYLRELERRAAAASDPRPAPPGQPSGQFLLEFFRSPRSDAANGVVYRDAQGIILLNRYPYAAGHLMVALGQARPTLMDYDPAQRAAFWRLVELGMEMMQKALRPQGINVGINQGRAAGAGVPEHLHAHLVPRWAGDTNFMSVVGQVRVIPDSLEAMAGQYRRVLAELAGQGAG